MNKRILSVFALSAAFLTVCAQQDKGGISPEMLNQIKQSYQGTTTDKAIRNAIGNNDIRKLALNQDNLKILTFPSKLTQKELQIRSRRAVAGCSPG